MFNKFTLQFSCLINDIIMLCYAMVKKFGA